MWAAAVKSCDLLTFQLFILHKKINKNEIRKHRNICDLFEIYSIFQVFIFVCLLKCPILWIYQHFSESDFFYWLKVTTLFFFLQFFCVSLLYCSSSLQHQLLPSMMPIRNKTNAAFLVLDMADMLDMVDMVHQSLLQLLQLHLLPIMHHWDCMLQLLVSLKFTQWY